MWLRKFTPADTHTVEVITRDNRYHKYSTEVVLLSGVMDSNLFVRSHGNPAFDIAIAGRSVDTLPRNTVLVGVTRSDGMTTMGSYKESDDGLSLRGKLDYKDATYYMIDVSRLMSLDYDDTYCRVPGLSLIFGTNRKELDSLEVFVSGGEWNAKPNLLENAAGSLIFPVVEPEDCRKNQTFYVNVLGKTHEIKPVVSTECGVPAGVYTGKYEVCIGSLDEVLYNGIESLKNDIVLFSNLSDAKRFSKAEGYLNALAETAKAEVLAHEQELVRLKAETNKTDNELKVKTIEAKGNYEVSSLSRKDNLEENSFARSLVLGSAALATATFGILAKMGSKVTFGDVFIGAISGKVVACSIAASILAGALLTESVRDTISTIVFLPLKVCGAVINGMGALVSGVCSVARGMFNSISGGIRRCLGTAF